LHFLSFYVSLMIIEIESINHLSVIEVNEY
jgi:hypothetical protein